LPELSICCLLPIFCIIFAYEMISSLRRANPAGGYPPGTQLTITAAKAVQFGTKWSTFYPISHCIEPIKILPKLGTYSWPSVHAITPSIPTSYFEDSKLFGASMRIYRLCFTYSSSQNLAAPMQTPRSCHHSSAPPPSFNPPYLPAP